MISHGRAFDFARPLDLKVLAQFGFSLRELCVLGDSAVEKSVNIGVLSGAHEIGLLQQAPAPHTHLLPSVAELLTL